MSKSYWMEEQNGNFSNDKEDTFNPEKRYVGIRLQQGVPLLDRDWNELEDLRRYEEMILRKWYIGDGVPADSNGFNIFDVDEVKYDFKIAKGRCLVRGFEAVNEPPEEAEYILYSKQEGIKPLTPPKVGRTDLVYLDVWIEEVASDVDDDLDNSQDVNIETCVRHKLEWRVRVRNKGSSGYEELFHHYYDIAKIEWKMFVKLPKITIEDLRNTGLSVHRLNEVIAILTNNSIADSQHRHSKLVGNDGSLDPALSVDNNGNVGIGTIEPGRILDVNGQIAIRPGSLPNAGIWLKDIFNQDEWFMGKTNLAEKNQIGFWRTDWRMVVESDGNVGIGTKEPVAKLDIRGDLALSHEGTDANDVRFSRRTSTDLCLHLSGFQSQEDPDPTYSFSIGHQKEIYIQPPMPNLPGFWISWFQQKMKINNSGDLYVSGDKGGFVVDLFINRVGDTLEQGDVVVISKHQVSYYSGDKNNVPIPEVDSTDKAYDSRVCGIVAKVVTEEDLPYVEGAPEVQTKSKKEKAIKAIKKEHPLRKLAAKVSKKLDYSKIKDKQMGKMVTLGAYAHCKVDADIAPIEVGDLLTTSPTKGHAQKVLEPEKAVGAIIGKALGALKKSKGEIPVLVMLQ